MQCKCDCCGRVVDIPDDDNEQIAMPKGWRRITTKIEEATDDHGSASVCQGDALNSCDDCNVHMTVDEHLEAELDARHRAMSGRPLIEPPPAPLPPQPQPPEPQDATGSAPPDTLGAINGDPFPEPDTGDIGVGTMVRPSAGGSAMTTALPKRLPTCPYCSGTAEVVGGDTIYPHRPDLAHLKFWLCRPCDAWAGTHVNSPTHQPKAGLAKADLRAARIEAHKAFDKLWRRRHMSRADAYRWLQQRLQMTRQPHIGFMEGAQCARVVELCGKREAA